MAKTATKKDQTVAEKLDNLYNLQKIDSEIDRIRTVRGELPLEVQDLEDEVEGLDTRIEKMQEEVKQLDTDISDRKNANKDADAAIAKYKEQQNNVRNNREFESISKEIEFQELEIKLNEKKTKESKAKISHKTEILDEAKERRNFRAEDLTSKKSELDEIVAETQAQEEKLIKKSDSAVKKMDARLAGAYTRLRASAKNGLAVVRVDRDSCGGCFNKIPPQRQLDIQSKKKVIVCEHCGRVLMPNPEEEA
ncbi:MAG: C4-type zinc ribbon domain-containing protein [Crocinitomicaceae bacterium]|nr:C4-type zinc ribbon domain-containing protein [Crocinitomicaceae bacterium]